MFVLLYNYYTMMNSYNKTYPPKFVVNLGKRCNNIFPCFFKIDCVVQSLYEVIHLLQFFVLCENLDVGKGRTLSHYMVKTRTINFYKHSPCVRLFLTIFFLQSGADHRFSNRGDAKDYVHARATTSTKPGSPRVLDALSCYLSLILKHSDTKLD